MTGKLGIFPHSTGVGRFFFFFLRFGCKLRSQSAPCCQFRCSLNCSIKLDIRSEARLLNLPYTEKLKGLRLGHLSRRFTLREHLNSERHIMWFIYTCFRLDFFII